MQKFDVIISVGSKDIGIVRKTIRYVNLNICPQRIYLLMNKRFFWTFSDSFLNKNNVVLLDESTLIPGMDINSVRTLVDKHFNVKMRAGWYFQQFLKMGFSLTEYAKDYYLIWDADTIPTSRIDFFDSEGRMMIAKKEEYHVPYFETMQKLLGFGKTVDFSFIAEHMIVNVSCMKEVVGNISKSNVVGNVWFEKIIEATNPNDIHAFSEFETYGTYLYRNYFNSFVLRRLTTMRHAGLLFGRSMSDREIKCFDGVLDTVSLEINDYPPFPRNIYQFVSWAILRILRP